MQAPSARPQLRNAVASAAGSSDRLARSHSPPSFAMKYNADTANATTSVRPGWFKRAITFGRAADKSVAKAYALGVRVSADGEGSRVVVDGATDADSTKAARDLLDVLRQRLN